MAPEAPCKGCGKRPCVCKFPPARVVLWRRRRGLPSCRPAHAFLDGEPVCEAGAIPAGTPTAFNGALTREFVDAPLSSSGRPYGVMCAVCESRLKVRGIAA